MGSGEDGGKRRGQGGGTRAIGQRAGTRGGGKHSHMLPGYYEVAQKVTYEK